MKAIINMFRNLMISYYNQKNNVWVISEHEFNMKADRTKPIIYINK